MSRFRSSCPRAISPSSRGNRSSPVTTPIRSLPPSFSRRATSATAWAQARGFTPPALAVTLMPRSTMIGRMRSINGTKSLAYPSDGSRDFCFCRMDMVTSAR